MNIFPTVGEGFEDVTTETIESTTKGTKELLFDYKTNKIVIKDGKVVMADTTEQIQQWVELFIKTEVDKYNIYKGAGFGYSYLYSIRGTQFSAASFVISEVERELREGLVRHEKIQSLKNISVTIDFNTLKVEFTIITPETEVSGEVTTYV